MAKENVNSEGLWNLIFKNFSTGNGLVLFQIDDSITIIIFRKRKIRTYIKYIYEYCDPNIMSIGILVIYILLQYTQLKHCYTDLTTGLGLNRGSPYCIIT